MIKINGKILAKYLEIDVRYLRILLSRMGIKLKQAAVEEVLDLIVERRAQKQAKTTPILRAHDLKKAVNDNKKCAVA